LKIPYLSRLIIQNHDIAAENTITFLFLWTNPNPDKIKENIIVRAKVAVVVTL